MEPTYESIFVEAKAVMEELLAAADTLRAGDILVIG